MGGGGVGGQEGGVRGVRVVKVMVGAIGQRGTVSPLSPCERDSGVSVFGLACSPPSLPRSLCPRSCFSLSLFVLAGTRRHLAATRSGARVHAQVRTQRRHAHVPSLVCFGSDQVPLTRTSKRQQSAKHTGMFTFTGAWTHTPRECKHDLPG